MLSTALRRRARPPARRNERARYKVAVLMGGVGHERSVSLASGREVVSALESAGHLVVPFELDSTDEAPLDALRVGFDLAFIALHGEFGEDGTIQRALSRRGVPYTGSGPEASARAFDKLRAKRVLRAAGIPVAPDQLLPFPFSARDLTHAIRSAPGPRAVVKPVRMGSSVGVVLCRDRGQVRRALEENARFEQPQLIEEYVPGHELTCGVLGDRSLPVVEIQAQRSFYDYEAKYQTEWGTHYEVGPAGVPGAVRGEVRRLALAAHRALGCDDVSRVDFRYDPDAGRVVVLEVNTIPGMTGTSLLPKAAAAAGLPFGELLTDLCRRALDVLA
jgi:D-alanine-D-alanine ligase